MLIVKCARSLCEMRANFCVTAMWTGPPRTQRDGKDHMYGHTRAAARSDKENPTDLNADRAKSIVQGAALNGGGGQTAAEDASGGDTQHHSTALQPSAALQNGTTQDVRTPGRKQQLHQQQQQQHPYQYQYQYQQGSLTPTRGTEVSATGAGGGGALRAHSSARKAHSTHRHQRTLGSAVSTPLRIQDRYQRNGRNTSARKGTSNNTTITSGGLGGLGGQGGLGAGGEGTSGASLRSLMASFQKANTSMLRAAPGTNQVPGPAGPSLRNGLDILGGNNTVRGGHPSTASGGHGAHSSARVDVENSYSYLIKPTKRSENEEYHATGANKENLEPLGELALIGAPLVAHRQASEQRDADIPDIEYMSSLNPMNQNITPLEEIELNKGFEYELGQLRSHYNAGVDTMAHSDEESQAMKTESTIHSDNEPSPVGFLEDLGIDEALDF